VVLQPVPPSAPRLRWAVVLLFLLMIHYLIWRVCFTLNVSSPLAAAISLLALLAELQLLATNLLQLGFSLWLPVRPGAIRTGSPRADVDVDGFSPSVDVLIPSYGEPLELIDRCLRGCCAMDYPSFTVWLLDDSGRHELRSLCDQLGVCYLTRGQLVHAKAGNLNHALAFCSGDLLAVFDADVVPLTTFLRRTAPLFLDPQLGFVQTPQSYMNADPVIRNLGLEHWLMPDEESFYRWIEPTRDAVGAVVCAGTSFLMRRSALDAVGGFETGTSSEDLSTGIRITAAGYRNCFLPEKLSAGLAPFTLAAMARQRSRWASGTLQTLRTGANPLVIPGLSLLQRFAYLEGIVHWLNVLPQLLLLLMPLSLGVLGVAPVLVNGDGLLRFALPYYGFQLLFTRWLTGHSRTALLPELYRWIFLLPVAAAVANTLLGRPMRFHVTPKALPQGRQYAPANSLVFPLLVLSSLQVVAGLNLLNPALGKTLAALSGATLTINLVWGALNLMFLLLALRSCWDRPGLSEQPWFTLSRPPVADVVIPVPGADGRFPLFAAKVQVISEFGVELLIEQPIHRWNHLASRAVGSVFTLQLADLPPLPVQLVAREKSRLGCTWGLLNTPQREALHNLLYRRPSLWPLRRAPFEPMGLLVVFGRLLIGCRSETWFRRSALPQQAWLTSS
jgi:cellulose synthase (UDP-forming)